MLAVCVRTVDAQPKDPNDYWSSSRPTPVPQYLLDLSQDTERTIVPQIVEGTTEFTARLRFLAGGDGGYVQGVTRFDAATGAERQYLLLVQDAEVCTVHLPASATETIVGFELSPHDQCLAVQHRAQPRERCV